MIREEAIKILSCRDNRGIPITWQDGFVDAVDTAIEALQERKTGKWIKKKNIMLGDYIECSLCKNAESRIAPGWWNAKRCCPNCGARMEVEDDNDVH